MSPLFLSGLFVLMCFADAFGQQKTVDYDLAYLMAGKQLSVINRDASVIKDAERNGIRLSARENDGVAWLNSVTFANGVIELDIKGKDVLQQSFVGIAFHGVTADSVDIIYFRPFNFRATDPVRKIHAVQYVSLPKYDWEVLRQTRNGQYEKAADPAPKADEWFHAKIVVNYPLVQVYVNGNTQPSLSIKMLSNTKKGKLGLWVGNNSDGDFANLSVTNQP
jgi:hypothetical protein